MSENSPTTNSSETLLQLARAICADAAVAFFATFVSGLIIASLAAAGLITMSLAYGLLVIAWLFAVVGSFLAPWKIANKHRWIFAVFLAAMLSGVGWYKSAHFEKTPSASEIADQVAARLADKELSENPPIGKLIVSKIQEPKIDQNGFVYINIEMKNNGQNHIYDMSRRSGMEYIPWNGDMHDYIVENLFNILDVEKPIKSGINTKDTGEEFMFSVVSAYELKDKWAQFQNGGAMLVVGAKQLYRDSKTPKGYVYEKQICAYFEKGSAIILCPTHNANTLRKE